MDLESNEKTHVLLPDDEGLLPSRPEPASVSSFISTLSSALCCRRENAVLPDGAAKRPYDATEHIPSVEELAGIFPSSGINIGNPSLSRGLSSAEASRLLATYGPNQLTAPPQTPEWLAFLLLFLDPFMLVLNVAGLLCFLASGLSDWDQTNLILGGTLFLVVLLTVIMTHVQHRETASVMAGFKNMMPDKCRVVRDGLILERDPVDIVVGDLVHLRIGQTAPADVRLLTCTDLKADFSSLTGEADAVRMRVEGVSREPHESRNLVFSSCGLVEGEALGLVIRTADSTFIGNIASLASSTVGEMTTLQREIHTFVKVVGIAAFVTAIIFFIVGAVRNPDNLVYVFVNAFIVVIVANVPEGLPTTVTACLTISAKRMRTRNVFIKKMDIVETLGSATVICSDKTGTLTQNRMTVVDLWYDVAVHAPPPKRAIQLRIQDGGEGHYMSPSSSSSSPSFAHTLSQNSLPASTSLSGAAGLLVAGSGVASASSSRRQSRTASFGAAMANLPGDAGGDLVREARAMMGGRKFSMDDEGRPILERSTSRGGGLHSNSAGTAAAEGGGRVGSSLMQESMLHRSFSSFGAFSGGGAAASANSSTSSSSSPSSVSRATWQNASSYMRLVVLAGVCNKAHPKTIEGGTGITMPTSSSSSSSAATTVAAPAAEVVLDGDASDQGFYRFVDGIVEVGDLRRLFRPLFEIPFNSTVKWSYAVIADPEAPITQHIAFMKGAPEVIIGKCTHYLLHGVENLIDADFSRRQRAAYEAFGGGGKRVLGFAYRAFSAAKDVAVYRADPTTCPKEGLVFAGLIALWDPPKEGVPEAILACHTASIRVTMVTGDHPLTAEAIARKVHIITGRTARQVAEEDGVEEDDILISDPRVEAVVFSGTEIAEKLTTPGAWDAVLSKQEVVFARTTPQQKLQIVENYQRRGEIVAVTGDGVNDSPALKKADIGVAMSISGSSVAKAAADILLLDDNFASIVAAIAEGRLLFDNLKKSIAYTLAHLWPELLPVFLNIAFSFPLALPGLIILTIDLFIEQGPSVSYSYEAAEGSIMKRPPRKQATDCLVSWPLLIYTYAIAGGTEMLTSMIAYFVVYATNGIPLSSLYSTADIYWTPGAPDFVVDGQVFSDDQQVDIYQQSVAAWYATIVLCQMWHVWICKTRVTSMFEHRIFENTTTIFGVAFAILLVLVVIFIPGLQTIFFTASLGDWRPWLVHLIFPAVILPFTEYTKYNVRNEPFGLWARTFAW